MTQSWSCPVEVLRNHVSCPFVEEAEELSADRASLGFEGRCDRLAVVESGAEQLNRLSAEHLAWSSRTCGAVKPQTAVREVALAFAC